MSNQMMMFSGPTMKKTKPVSAAGDEIQRLATQIVSARARYAHNKDIRDDPTEPAMRRQRARQVMRTVGGRIVKLIEKRKALINDHRIHTS